MLTLTRKTIREDLRIVTNGGITQHEIISEECGPPITISMANSVQKQQSTANNMMNQYHWNPQHREHISVSHTSWHPAQFETSNQLTRHYHRLTRRAPRILPGTKPPNSIGFADCAFETRSSRTTNRLAKGAYRAVSSSVSAVWSPSSCAAWSLAALRPAPPLFFFFLALCPILGARDLSQRTAPLAEDAPNKMEATAAI